MAAGERRRLGKRMKPVARGLAALGVLALGGCASLIAEMLPEQRIKAEDYVACDKSKSALSPVSEDICEQVNDLIHKEAGLEEAVVGFDVAGKGRLQLAGKFKDEKEVEQAFAMIQAVVGSDWVSPVKPGHIQVEAWQQCLTEKFAGRECSDAEQEGYEIHKKPPGPVRNKYALIVGVGRFKNKIKQLNFAVKDAEAVADYLTDPKLGNFPSSHVTVLTDEKASRLAILDALSDLERRAKPDDLVVVYFSSHGAPPDKFDRVNIVTWDTDLLFGGKNDDELSWREKILQREALWNTSVSQQRLHEFFRRVPSKRVLMILDVCYSGDVFSQIPGFKPTGSAALAEYEENYATGYSAEQLAAIFGSKDLSVENGGSQPTGSSHVRQSRPRTKSDYRRTRSFSKPAKSWGKVILSASSGKEKSWEPDPRVDSVTPNSYFTHYFLENLRGSGGRIQESFHSALLPVGDAAMGKGKTQQPQFFSVPDLDAWNFSLNTKR